MENNLPEDNLDKFLKQKLEEGLQDNRDWNRPSKMVWENAAPQFQKKKKNPRIIFFWIFGGLLLAGLFVTSFSLFYLNEKLEDVNQKFEHLEKNIQEESKIKKSEESIKDNNSNTKTSDTPIAISKKTENNVASNSKNTYSNKIKNTQSNNNSNHKTNNKSYSTSNNTYKANSTSALPPVISQNKNIFIKEQIPPALPIAIDEKMPTTQKQQIEPVLPLGTTVTRELVFIPKKDTQYYALADPAFLLSKFDLTVYYAPSVSSTNMQGEMDGNFGSLSGYDNFKYMNRLGIEGAYSIHRHWQIVGGVEYKTVQSQSSNQFDLTYETEMEETNLEGIVNTRLYVPVETSLGTADGQVIITRPTSVEIEDEEALNCKINYNQKLHFIASSLGLRYKKHINNTKLHYALTGGLRLNSLLRDDTQFSAQLAYEETPLQETAHSMEIFNGTNNPILDYYLEAGLSYAISNKIDARLSADYSRNINPVFQENNMTTSWQAIGLKTGLSYKF